MLSKKLGIKVAKANMLVFCAGIFELLALGALTTGLVTANVDMIGVASLMLLFFTGAVTVTFWIVPFDKVKALHNISSMGGLLLLFCLRDAVAAQLSRQA